MLNSHKTSWKEGISFSLSFDWQANTYIITLIILHTVGTIVYEWSSCLSCSLYCRSLWRICHQELESSLSPTTDMRYCTCWSDSNTTHYLQKKKINSQWCMINRYYQFFMVKGGLDRRGICYVIRKQVATLGANWLRSGAYLYFFRGWTHKGGGGRTCTGEKPPWTNTMLPVQISPLQSNLPITKTDDFDKGCQTLGLISPVLRAWSSSSLRYL